MTDQDELRDRIADILSRTYTSGPAKVVLEDIAAAQAIIDELGLRMETEPGHGPRECGCSSRAYPAESRVVGKWEAEQ